MHRLRFTQRLLGNCVHVSHPTAPTCFPILIRLFRSTFPLHSQCSRKDCAKRKFLRSANLIAHEHYSRTNISSYQTVVIVSSPTRRTSLGQESTIHYNIYMKMYVNLTTRPTWVSTSFAALFGIHIVDIFSQRH